MTTPRMIVTAIAALIAAVAQAQPETSLQEALQLLHSGNPIGALEKTRQAEFELLQRLANSAPSPPGPPAAAPPPAANPSPLQTQIAPADPRFNQPLDIPLDNTRSVVDFVSFPEGDRQDQVRFRVIGMNPNPSLPGGRARLIIAASCFGESPETLSFNLGRRTFTCGQTLVDREVTAASSTGSITIAIRSSATPAYVQWVLTGTATRTN